MKIIDRLTISWLFPEKGSFEDLILIDDIKKKASFSQEEVEEIGLKTEWNTLHRDATKEKDKKITFSESEKNMIAKTLKDLSEKKELTTQHLSLYRTFIK